MLAASVALPPVVPAPVDAVGAGTVTDTLTFEEPPDAVARPMPPTDDAFELVVAEEFEEVPMLFRLEPPPWPMPTELEPEIEPDDEFAVVSA
ncbi:hypothetical protein AB6809_33260 [Paraburkholderia sp. RCC_158]|uniref:hypothetical protein n=1 Tax=Paraburkholderia sp. RCC_158 TaxID=3239220 RepID=UPI0035246010